MARGKKEQLTVRDLTASLDAILQYLQYVRDAMVTLDPSLVALWPRLRPGATRVGIPQVRPECPPPRPGGKTEDEDEDEEKDDDDDGEEEDEDDEDDDEEDDEDDEEDDEEGKHGRGRRPGAAGRPRPPARRKK